MRLTFVVLFGYAVLACAVYLRNVGRPAGHPDREVARFLSAQGWSDLATNAVLLLAAVGLAHGRVWQVVLAVALVVQGSVYTWRGWLSRRMPRARVVKLREASKVNTRFKIDPEVVRLIQLVAGGVLIFLGTAGVSDVIPERLAVVLMALAGAVIAVCAGYAQGLHTPAPVEPPEASRLLTGAEPHEWPAEYAASGRATVGTREPTAEWLPDSRPDEQVFGPND